MTNERYSRNTALFGAAGQDRIAASRALIAGLGGLGCHVGQQLAYLGVTDFGLIDDDITTGSSLNRLIGAFPSDVVNKTAKVATAQRLITAIQPDADVRALPFRLQDERTASAFAHADVCFSCLDDDLARVALIERCGEHGLVFFDLATDTEDTDALRYGGRVLFSGAGERCPYCMDLLDPAELSQRSLPSDARRAAREIYGIRHDNLAATGPAVVSLNGVVASLAVTEFMVWRTGLRDPASLLTYRAQIGTVGRSMDPPAIRCPYCSRWASRRSAA
jgi:molybdopterin/thiamine biosynthesis adenylyltransferase